MPMPEPGEPGMPDRRSASPPALSVILASRHGRTLLDACLSALVPQCAVAGAELIVARSADAGDHAEIARRYPGVRLVTAPEGTDLPRLRGLGIAAARGELVALTEDHCRACPTWVSALARHARGPADVVGGPMDNERRGRAVDWGAYFSEYGFVGEDRRAAVPRPGAAPPFTGANVAYARRVVSDVAAWSELGAWENVIHDRLAAQGCVFHWDGDARVALNESHRFRPFCVDRYRHGCDYARTRLKELRAAGAPRWRRALLLAVAPALPALLVYRVASRMDPGGQAIAFVRALPFTVAFLAAWSVGEFVGYLRGPAR
jgi:hypothetical protein